MQRRALLSSCAVLAVGGCLGTRTQQRSSLAWLWLQNDRDERYEVDVVVEDDGEQVFAENYEVGTTPDTANVRVDNPVAGPWRYVVRARMDGERREVNTTELVDGDEDCIGVRFSLLDNGSVETWTKSMEQC